MPLLLLLALPAYMAMMRELQLATISLLPGSRGRRAVAAAEDAAAAPAWLSCTAAGQLCGVTPALREHCFGSARDDGSIQTSLVVVVRDRAEALLHVLPSWLQVQGLDELVLVDWGSRPGLASVLRRRGPADTRLRQIAAPLEAEWNLGRAYNLAVRCRHRWARPQPFKISAPVLRLTARPAFAIRAGPVCAGRSASEGGL